MAGIWPFTLPAYSDSYFIRQSHLTQAQILYIFKEKRILPYTFPRRSDRILFSILDTCTWEVPRRAAISVWVMS